MYRLNLLSDLPEKDIGKLIAITVCAGFFGVFFVIPLRKYYIVHQKLTFPTPAATVSIIVFLLVFSCPDICRRTLFAPCIVVKQGRLPPRRRLWHCCSRFV